MKKEKIKEGIKSASTIGVNISLFNNIYDNIRYLKERDFSFLFSIISRDSLLKEERVVIMDCIFRQRKEVEEQYKNKGEKFNEILISVSNLIINK